MFYREPIKLHYYEVIEYDRKSRMDDPLLSIEEVLEKHEKILDEYAQKYLGGSIPNDLKYKELGSGETIKNRPVFQEVLKLIESPAIKAIMVVDVQRLSRGDLEDAGRLIKLLRYTNTYVITPMKVYDLRDEYDRDAFERELKRGNAYLEYFKKIPARGKLASVAAGNYVGSVAPFGFNRVEKEDGNKTCFVLEEKKEEADIVRLVFDWYCNELIGVEAICRRLEAMGVKTKSGAYKWHPYVIFNMLENDHYIGLVRWNWRKVVKVVEEQEIKAMRPKAKVDEYLIFNGKHDPIISEELFERAKRIRGSRPPYKTETSLKNPLSGIMYCKCGARIGYNTFTRRGKAYAPPKLKCNNQVRCKSGSADFQEVIDYICQCLRDCIADFKIRIKNKKDDSTKLHTGLIDNLKKKLKELEAQELSQWEAQSHPDEKKRMPEHIFQKLNEKLLAEKEEVNKLLCEAEKAVPKQVDYKERILKFTDALNALEDPDIPPKITNQYLKDIIERIDYERPPIVRITKKNAHLYETDIQKGLQYHIEPYTIRIEIK